MENFNYAIKDCHPPLRFKPTTYENDALAKYRYVLHNQRNIYRKFRETNSHAEILPFNSSLDLFRPLQPALRDRIPVSCQNMHLCQYEESSGAPMQYSEDPAAQEISQIITEHPGYTNLVKLATSNEEAFGTLELFQHHCLQGRLGRCTSQRCSEILREFDELAPACDWKPFRDWLLTAMCCALAADNVGDVWLLDFTVYGFQQILCLGKVEDSSQRLVYQVHELIYFWHSEISSLKVSERDILQHERSLAQWRANDGRCAHITDPQILSALSTAASLGICPKRLWTLARISNRGIKDIPVILDTMKQSKSSSFFAHPDHNQCSPEFCPHETQNSTRQEQLHRCLSNESEKCDILKLPIKDFEEIIIESASNPTPPEGAIVWPTDMTKPITPFFAPKSTYVAISHVWSDGTGVGLREPGMVNECLYRTFAFVAAEYGYKGFWWDTICVPRDRKAKRIVLNNMNLNYKYAAFTLVHDEYLSQFPWRQDGTPAIALVLSPWFTRGWTALELAMSNKVLVPYRLSLESPFEEIIVDLEDDIITQGIASLGHRVGIRLIQRIKSSSRSLLDVLKIMSCRTTSWAQDRIMITALMAQARHLEYGESVIDMTKKILRTCNEIPKSFIFHGHTTLHSRGPFSWCPYNLFDSNLAVTSAWDRRPKEMFAWKIRNLNKMTEGRSEFEKRRFWNQYIESDNFLVLKDGTAFGYWGFQLISIELSLKLRPYSSHGSRGFQIRVALSHPSRLMLLRHTFADLAILVQPTATGILSEKGSEHRFDNEMYIDCHYIGCVSGNFNEFESTDTGYIRIGSDKKECSSAQKVVDDYKMGTGYIEELDRGKKTQVQFLRASVRVGTVRASDDMGLV